MPILDDLGNIFISEDKIPNWDFPILDDLGNIFISEDKIPNWDFPILALGIVSISEKGNS